MVAELAGKFFEGAGGASGVDTAHGVDELVPQIEGGVDVAEGECASARRTWWITVARTSRAVS
ncbi:hypothetical protein [Streptomyces cadmiisoli]|uniref:hypothetical protein n=1 Tax=Streptomyces cadmiisoli TaxID=2184053 RepID=UPI003D712132